MTSWSIDLTQAVSASFVESFNGRFRDGCLNQQWFRDLVDAQRVIDDWREHYK